LLHAEPASVREAPLTSLPAAYGTAILLTLSNAPTLIAFAALFTITAPVGRPHLSTALATTAGISKIGNSAAALGYICGGGNCAGGVRRFSNLS